MGSWCTLAKAVRTQPSLISGILREAGTQRQVAQGCNRVPDLITERGPAPSDPRIQTEQHIRDEANYAEGTVPQLPNSCL